MLAIKGFHRLASFLSNLGAFCSAMMILFMAGMILLEIVLRSFFGTSTYMSDELVAYAVAASGLLSLGYTFKTGGIIRVTLLLGGLKNYPRLRALCELVCIVLTFGAVSLLVYYMYGNVERQFLRGYTSGTMSGMPQWIPTAGALSGLIIFLIQLFSYFLETLLKGYTATDDEVSEILNIEPVVTETR